MKFSKKIFALASALMLAVAAHAQVFILSDDEFEDSKRSPSVNGTPLAPQQGGDIDQSLTEHVPLGSGVLLLSVLGGAFLLGKRKKDDDK